jgi:hypothetical protein
MTFAEVKVDVFRCEPTTKPEFISNAKAPTWDLSIFFAEDNRISVSSCSTATLGSSFKSRVGGVAHPSAPF